MKITIVSALALALAASTVTAADLSRRQNPISRAPTATTGDASPTTANGAAPSPTESTGCVPHEDHWHCSGTRSGSSSTDESSSSGEVISDTAGKGCIQHGTHYHCPAGVTASCAASLGDYDLDLHIVALFILLIASALGVFLPPLLGAKGKVSKKINSVFFVFRHFGSGVIISTAFIHLLLHAFVMFSNECLGELAYEPVAPAIAMAALMLVFCFDYAMARHMALSRAASGLESPSKSDEGCDKLGHDHDFSQMKIISPEGKDKRAHWDVKLLEAGICFHSIMIGVTLGAQGGSGFIPTFCAIVFHQLFEGLGLGSRIAVLNFERSFQKWAMCVVYALITPVGIGIGIGIRNSFNLSGKATILSIGILDSISAGILLYASIAQLLVGDWLAGDMRTASRGKVLVGGVALFLGLFAMALIGKWA